MTTNPPQPKHWLIIPAAGIGSRMAATIPKQYIQIHGKAILQHTIERMIEADFFFGIFLALHPEDTYWSNLPISSDARISTYIGGSERADSVALGLNELKAKASKDDWVWVHDAARPLISESELDALKNALKQTDVGAVLALQATDTIKLKSQHGDVSTIPREQIWRAQTPQVFRFETLSNAYDASKSSQYQVTDESSAVEALGYNPILVPGSPNNIKITVPEDIQFAASHLKSGVSSVTLPFRIGSGFDVHAFCEGDYITLGGVQIPHSKGFKAHSDGDVLLHSICDALLGALSLGDIGKHFPDTDAKWKGANSRDLLRAVYALVLSKGYEVGNVDATIVAQAPKMAPHIMAMQENIAEDLEVDVSVVSVKATTSERLGFEGREEGISSQASVLLSAVNNSGAPS